MVGDGGGEHRREADARHLSTLTRSIAGSPIASAIARMYGASRIGPGSATTSGKMMLASIQSARPACRRRLVICSDHNREARAAASRGFKYAVRAPVPRI